MLGAVYPPQIVSDGTLWDAVSSTLKSEAAMISTWLDQAPQTNEVRRAATLIAAGHLLSDRYKLPIRTSELGASGGLNLHWDSFALRLGDHHFGSDSPALTLQPDWSGPLPPKSVVSVTGRSGVDLNPLDPACPEDALRLQAYLWPDQPDRLRLTRAAIAVAQTPVTQGDAVDWLAGQLAHRNGELHLIYSTVAWQYFPADKQAAGTQFVEAAGAAASAASPLAWFGMENDGGSHGAALTLRLWPGDLKVDLGRADFHGRWIEWRGFA
jgi:hypothetical protein